MPTSAFSPDQVFAMLDFDKDFVAGAYPLKTFPIILSGVLYAAEEHSKDRFVPAEMVGDGFMLLTRRAIERMIAAYPELRYEQDCTAAGPASYALFNPMIVGARYLSEDWAFCHRWRALGGTIWVDTEGRMSHTGPHTFLPETGPS
jgi:hypothetical protein